jgi:hypothetical protein
MIDLEERGLEDTDRCRCGHYLFEHAQDEPFDLACMECECESFEEPELPDWGQE